MYIKSILQATIDELTKKEDAMSEIVPMPQCVQLMCHLRRGSRWCNGVWVPDIQRHTLYLRADEYESCFVYATSRATERNGEPLIKLYIPKSFVRFEV